MTVQAAGSEVFVLQTKSTRKRIRSVQCSFYATSSQMGSLTARCWGSCVHVPTFWYRLNQADQCYWVVLDKQPLNGYCCSMISKTYVRARRTYCVSWLRGSITVLTAVAKLTLPHGLLRGCTVMDTEDLAASIWPPPLSASTRWRRISYHKKYTHLYTTIGEVIINNGHGVKACAVMVLTNYPTRWRFGLMVVHWPRSTVSPHRAQLVPGWVTIFRWANHLNNVTSHPGQLSLAIPRGQTWVPQRKLGVNKHTMECTSPYPW